MLYINGRFLTQPITGVQRFAREILQAGGGNAGTLLAPVSQNMPESFAGIKVRGIGSRTGHLWEQLELSPAASDGFLVNLCNTAPLLRKNQIVVLHDAAFAALPRNFTRAFRAWYQIMARTYALRARIVATVSKFSASEIIKYFGISPNKIEIIPESGEHILRSIPDYSLHEKFGLEEDGYFLAVSSLAPYKNFTGILKAVSVLPTLKKKFVIVGGRNARVFNSSGMDIGDAIETGYVSDEQLRALYERASCFVYPSFYEGFGLPPLEAMACGCPVLVSDVASLPEVCGDAVSYCNPYDPRDIAKQLLRLLESPAARAQMREAGRVRSRQWTWLKAASRLDEVIAQAMPY